MRLKVGESSRLLQISSQYGDVNLSSILPPALKRTSAPRLYDNLFPNIAQMFSDCTMRFVARTIALVAITKIVIQLGNHSRHKPDRIPRHDMESPYGLCSRSA